MGSQTAHNPDARAQTEAPMLANPPVFPLAMTCEADTESQNVALDCSTQLFVDHTNVSITRANGEKNRTLVTPIQSYSGIMVRINADMTSGQISAELVLQHTDAQFCVVLARTASPEELADSWQNWSDSLGLPMLVCDTNGHIKPIDCYSVRPGGNPAPRRKLALLTGRRPRFLVRRKCGNISVQLPVYKDEREITARA